MPKPKPQYLSKVYTIDLNNVTNDSAANLPVSDATQTALNAKQNTLVSGTNIKTINSTSLLGSGNIAIGGTGTVTDVSVVTANGISGSVATSTTTPAITLSLGAVTPSSVSVNLTPPTNVAIPDGYGSSYPRRLNVNGDITYTIGSGSVLQIT